MGRHGTIANRKSAQDSKRAAMFTKYSRQIIVAAKGGGDPEFNPSLRVAIDKAKAIGMPNDNINRAIKKGTGELGGESYEELQFEGYGPSGVAVIVESDVIHHLGHGGIVDFNADNPNKPSVMIYGDIIGKHPGIKSFCNVGRQPDPLSGGLGHCEPH